MVFTKERTNITALTAAFSRAYHFENNTDDSRVFSDEYARRLFSDEEYECIAGFMNAGTGFYGIDPGAASGKETLRRIVECHLAPAVLGRSAFAENALATAVGLGVRQYVMLAAGYDTYAARHCCSERVRVYEIDRAAMQKDKLSRYERVGIVSSAHYVPADLADDNWAEAFRAEQSFNADQLSFISALGISYYLKKEEFRRLAAAAGEIAVPGSSLVFDYPDGDFLSENAGRWAKEQAALAGGAGEKMFGAYAYEELEMMLYDCGFLVYEHLSAQDITERYFAKLRKIAPDLDVAAPENVNYCLAVKKPQK